MATNARRRIGCGRSRAAAALAVVAGAALVPSAATATPTAPAQSYDGHLEDANAWAIEQVNAPAAWDTTRGEGVTIAVVDTGMGEHPFFEDKDVLPGYSNYVEDEEDAWHDAAPDLNDPEDRRGHGTGVAAMALLVAPEATILPVRRESGLPTGFDVGGAGESDFEAIRWAVDNGADVIAMAWGTCCTEADEDFFMALQYAVDNDVVLVASSGNDPDQIVQNHAPASIPGVVSVSGTTSDGGPWETSTVGPEVVMAGPADYTLAWPIPQQGRMEDDCSWCPSDDDDAGPLYTESGGTSATAGWVAGAVALVRSAQPDLDASNVIQRLIQTADDRGAEGRDDIFGYGVPDAGAAIAADVETVDESPIGYPLAVAGASGETVTGEPAPGTGGPSDAGDGSSGGSGDSDVVPLLVVAGLAAALGGGAWLLLHKLGGGSGPAAGPGPAVGRHGASPSPGASPLQTGVLVTVVVALVAAVGTYVGTDALVDKTESDSGAGSQGESAAGAADAANDAGDDGTAGSDGDTDDAGDGDTADSAGSAGDTDDTAAAGNPAAVAAQRWQDAYMAGDLDTFLSLTCENPWYRVAMNIKSLEDPGYPRPGFALLLDEGWEADDYRLLRQSGTKALVEAGDLSIGGTADEEIALVLEEGEWKVCDFWLTGPWWQGVPEWEERWPHDPDDSTTEPFRRAD